MARPKRSVAPPLWRSKAQESHVVYPTLLDVLQSRPLFPGERGVGENQAVMLENGRVVHMRAKKEATWQEDHSGVEQAVQQESGFEKKPSLVGGGSSSFNMESDGEDLTGSDQDLPSEEAVHGFGTPQVDHTGTHNFGKHEDEAEFVCTACGRSVAIVEVQAHPVLHVGVCQTCYDFLFSSPFTKDNPQDPFEHENECRWCGDGGEVILCDTCPKAFCKRCIKRNFGEEILNAIESPTQEWSCFACNDYHLQTLIREYKNVENLVKTMNRSGQPQKSRTSRESNSQMRSRRPRRRSTTEAELANETIATIIARKKENLRRRYPEKYFTGFERPQQREHPQHHFLFAQNNTKREHGTSESGGPIPEVHILQNGNEGFQNVVQQNFQDFVEGNFMEDVPIKQDSKQESEYQGAAN